MVLYIAYSDAGQFVACMCQISLVFLSLRKRNESTPSCFLLILVLLLLLLLLFLLLLLLLFAGPVCKVNYLTQRGKKVQLARILFLILIPLLGVWVFTIFSLYDYIQSHDDIEKVSHFVLLGNVFYTLKV